MGKILKLKKLFSVPDTNGASNFGGIAYGDSTIFAIKANQAETIATLHEIRQDGSVLRTKFTGLCHTNGLTYYNGSVYVPLWGSKQAKKGVCRISIADYKKHVISADFKLSNIAHYKDNLFITRTGTSSDKKTQTFYVIRITDSGISKVKKFLIKNPLVGDGYTTNQDIYYNDGRLYVMETKSSLLKSAVLVYNIGDPEANVSYKAVDTWTSSNTSKWEIETMCIDDSGRVLFGMNTSSDGIYTEEEEEVKMGYTIKTIEAHSSNYGGARNAQDVKNLVVHYTGNKTDTSVANGNYFKNGRKLGASAHDFVDDTTVVHSVPYNRVAYSVGKNYGKNNLFGKVTNSNSINVEMCSKDGKITEKTFSNTVELCRSIMKKYGIPPQRVYRHYDVCSKSCPGWKGWIPSDESIWNRFKKEIEGEKLEGQATDFQPYVVRVTSQDLNVRKGPSASTEVVTIVAKGECYTITEVVYNGSTAWGKLKSGVGYISLAYTERV